MKKFLWFSSALLTAIILVIFVSTFLITGEIGHVFVAPNLSAPCSPEKPWPIPLKGCMHSKNAEQLFDDLGAKYEKTVIADVRAELRSAPNLMVKYSAVRVPIAGFYFDTEATFFNDRLMNVILRQTKVSHELDVELKRAIELFGSHLVDNRGAYWEWREQKVADEFERWENIYQ